MIEDPVQLCNSTSEADNDSSTERASSLIEQPYRSKVGFIQLIDKDAFEQEFDHVSHLRMTQDFNLSL